MASAKDETGGGDDVALPAVPDAPAIPTGFPELPAFAPPEPRKPSRPGYVTLATRPPVGSLSVPPLEGGGETVTITVDGTEVDAGTAARARHAATLAGTTLREL